MIPRPDYTDKLYTFKSSDMVKVLIGVRRCGKSSLLKLFKQNLLSQGLSDNQFIEINFEYPGFLKLQEPQEFYRYVKDRIISGQEMYLFVDEVQELKEWAKTINGIRAEFPVDIYVTGSNSRMFIGEHLTYLSGRYLRIEVFPLSFKEFLAFRGIDNPDKIGFHSIEQLFSDYVVGGSFPAVVLSDNAAIRESILDGLFESVFTRDILLRGRIQNEAAFLRVARYVLDNVGNHTSATSIANTLKSGGHSISIDTVENYLTLMSRAHLLYSCNRYDIRGKEHLRTNGKHYAVDSGLKNRVLGQSESNRGRVTENIVYLELLRRGFEVSTGVFSRIQTEIDFVTTRQGRRYYIQVSETVLDEATRSREFEPFSLLNDGYPRILITKDNYDYSQDGVRHVNFYEFLLNQNSIEPLTG